MQQLEAPLVGLSTRCKLPLTLPQLLGLMQSAQAQAGSGPGAAAPDGLPALSQAAQTAGAPAVLVAAQPSVAGVGTQGSGPLPGPSARATGQPSGPAALPRSPHPMAVTWGLGHS